MLISKHGHTATRCSFMVKIRNVFIQFHISQCYDYRAQYSPMLLLKVGVVAELVVQCEEHMQALRQLAFVHWYA